MAPTESEPSKARIVVLISGSGTNLQTLIDQAQSGQLPIHIAAVISNRPGVKGLDRARDAGISAEVIDHHEFASRDLFDAELMRRIDSQQPDLVVLAGFMRVLTPEFCRRYLGRMMNIHPSLLPKYPGLHTHQRALQSGDAEHGASVHFVTDELDGGPVIIQAKVPILSGDTEQLLAQRVLQQEHIIYPLAIQWFIGGKLIFRDNRCYLNAELLPDSGYLYH